MYKKILGLFILMILFAGSVFAADYYETLKYGRPQSRFVSDYGLTTLNVANSKDTNIIQAITINQTMVSFKPINPGTTTVDLIQYSPAVTKTVQITVLPPPFWFAKGANAVVNTDYLSVIDTFPLGASILECLIDEEDYIQYNDTYSTNTSIYLDVKDNEGDTSFEVVDSEDESYYSFKVKISDIEPQVKMNLNDTVDDLKANIDGLIDNRGNKLETGSAQLYLYIPNDYKTKEGQNEILSKEGTFSLLVLREDAPPKSIGLDGIYPSLCTPYIFTVKVEKTTPITEINVPKWYRAYLGHTIDPIEDEVYTVNEGADPKAVTIESSDPNIAEITEDNKIKATGIGNCTITITSNDDPSISESFTWYTFVQYAGKGEVYTKSLSDYPVDDYGNKVDEFDNIVSISNPDILGAEITNDNEITFTGKGEGYATIKIDQSAEPGVYRYITVQCVNSLVPAYKNHEVEISKELISKTPCLRGGMPFDGILTDATVENSKGEFIEVTIENDTVKFTPTEAGFYYVRFYDELENRYTYYVYANVAVESITVAPETLNLKVGEEADLTATVLPETADQTVTWKTGNENVATVDQNGHVKVTGVGVTYIKATTNGTNSEGEQLFMDCILRVDKDFVESISLNKNELTLSLGADETLVPTILPESANYKKVGWTVGNPKVATVDKTGKVTAVGYGTTYVYCTTYATDAEGNRLKDSCKVTVTSDPVQNLIMPIEEKELSLGDEYSITAIVTPSTAIQDVTWTVGNKNVATVDKTGKVTAVGYGTTYVTAITKGVDANGNRLKSRCKIVVSSDPAESITLSETVITLSVGDQETLTATVAPETADQSVTWTIGNKKVATIDKTGKVTAVGAGSTYVTVFSKAKDANGNRLKTRCKVIVLSEPF